jgi:SNF2 family DNA or RNA helicase
MVTPPRYHARIAVALSLTDVDSSIVFSFWRTSLDQVGAMLQRHNIAYLRIDGSVPNAERQRALCGFDNATERMVLLMTIGTGAVG